MMQAVMGALMVAIGCLSAGVGVVLARNRWRAAHRSFHRTASLSAATAEGWDSWFLGGFSEVTMGIRRLSTVLAWLVLTLAGAWFVGAGIKFFAG
jgi:hypothetical protein